MLKAVLGEFPRPTIHRGELGHEELETAFGLQEWQNIQQLAFSVVLAGSYCMFTIDINSYGVCSIYLANV